MQPSRERLEGYHEALKKNKLPIRREYVVQTDLSRTATQAAMHQLLELAKPPAAVIAFNDYVALDAMQYARKAGKKINRDIFFVSYANLPVTNYLDQPPIASVEQFPYQQAEKATRMLLDLVQAKGKPLAIQKRVVLESKVVVNE